MTDEQAAAPTGWLLTTISIEVLAREAERGICSQCETFITARGYTLPMRPQIADMITAALRDAARADLADVFTRGRRSVRRTPSGYVPERDSEWPTPRPESLL